MSKDRFDLENDINALYSSADDLRTVADMMYDSDLIYSADRTHTVLQGIAEVIYAKVEKLADTFEQVFQLNEYAPDDIKRQREEVLQRLRDAQLKELRGVLDDSEDEDKSFAELEQEAFDEAVAKTLINRVYNLLCEYEAMSVPVMSKMLGASETSVSATIRDLRKAKNGGHTIVSFEEDGCTKYSLVLEDEDKEGM